MGVKFFDQFSILHASSGVIAYFWGMSFQTWFVLHLLFEILENTDVGMHFINTYFTLWPGGKESSDSFLNMVSDQFFGMFGWLVAHYLDTLNL